MQKLSLFHKMQFYCQNFHSKVVQALYFIRVDILTFRLTIRGKISSLVKVTKTSTCAALFTMRLMFFVSNRTNFIKLNN